MARPTLVGDWFNFLPDSVVYLFQLAMTESSARNIVLIGMPAAGKSTLGVLLAKQLGYDFVDTDLLIQRQADKTLASYLKERGYQALRRLEAQVIQALTLTHTVIATGGSAVCSPAATTPTSGLERAKAKIE